VTVATLVLAVGVVVVLAGLVAWERGGGGAREVALAATLAAAAAAGRLLFAAIPSATPVTTIVICAGIALGGRVGAAVGATAALVSNAFLGQGPWTPWQMLSWGLVGTTSGLFAPLLRRSRAALLVFGAVWGLLFGAIMDVYQLAAFGPVFTLPAFVATHARGLPFDITHAVTNVVLLSTAGPALIRLLERYARRLRVEITPYQEPKVCAADSPPP
jgi:energy-coupling factor transport system substrate-specific component